MKAPKVKARLKRKTRVRQRIFGEAKCPRLTVYRSNTNIYAQLVDDTKGQVLASASTLNLKGKVKNASNIEAAKQVGELIADKAKAIGVKKVVFDRSGFLFHGRVKALADSAREKGLKF
ncbi:MAG: 50S ribosomal protein L18 [Actinobacteria bacterium]|nr:MAG: 50S ribosomal protein L18 [Actinomycetota bacterium]